MKELGEKFSGKNLCVEPEYEGRYFVELENGEKPADFDNPLVENPVFVKFHEYTVNCNSKVRDRAILFSTAPTGMLFMKW